MKGLELLHILTCGMIRDFVSKVMQSYIVYIDVFVRGWGILTCGMMEILFLRSCNPILCILMLSIIITPVGSTRRNNIVIRLLFPAPVRPTIPT